ncbi:PREDICTED: E3 ubiquitin protein ligase DRIP1-like [Lupinus angustifolius]|uniref:E3 ubiquitin protein ligase DRIP1-like n=1 Tax=Lupinus angustifolius TaxID=3871 RepID=UPI00092FC3CC|nr:PREDICTED: E3 ubiquitin protein ligase DRIP1-like [Lupinus angustifolius]
MKEPRLKAKVSPPLTCLLCNDLFKDATTVIECMHTFCRECIEKKIIDENLRHCPECNVDLGCSPLDKLREDQKLQNYRDRFSPKYENKTKAPEDVPLVPLTKTRKEVSAPSLKANAGKSKAAGKKVVTQTKSKNNSSKEERSKQVVANKTSDGIGKSSKKGKADMSKPLTSLVEATRNIKINSNSHKQESAVIPVPVDSSGNDSHVPKVQKKHRKAGRKQGKKEGKSKFIGDLNLPPPPPPPGFGLGSENSHKFGNLPSQQEIGSSSQSNKAVGGGLVWLSLVASEDREIGARLPQIPTRFLRLDGSLPVSYLEKYVIKKLGLPSYAEVEIQLWGQPVYPSYTVQNLLDMWLETMPKNKKIHTTVGSSAEDFIMVLSYGLKA